MGWREVWQPSPKVDPGAFSGQRQGWKTPRRTLWQCTAPVCSGSALLWDLLGVSISRDRDLLFVLLIYPRKNFLLCIHCILSHSILLYVVECWLLWFSCHTCLRPFSVWPDLFCGAGHEKKRGEHWSSPWHLGCTFGSFPCAQLPGLVHTARLGRVCFSVLSCVPCLFICAFWFVCLSPFFCVSLSSWVICLIVLGTSITNLNEPPRALATSTITWVRS